MGTITGKADMERFEKFSAQIATHEGAISALGNRIGHVEKTLVDHGTILHTIEKAVTKQEHRPTLNVHQISQTVYHWVVLFSMVVGGIIYIAVAQNSSFVASVNTKLEAIDSSLAEVGSRVGWSPTIRRSK